MLEKKTIEVKNNILPIFFLFYTFFDAFAYVGAFNSLVKLFFYATFFYLVIKNYSFDSKIVFMLFLLGVSFIVKFLGDRNSFSMNFRAMITIFNPFLFYLLFSTISNKEKFFSFSHFLLFFRIFYTAIYSSLIIGKITGIGNYYRFGKTGYKGLFLGTNEIGIYLILLIAYLFFLKDFISWQEILFVLSANMIFGYLVFTKSSLFAALFSFILINLFFKKIRTLTFSFLILEGVLSLLTDTFLTKTFYLVLSKSQYIKVLSANFLNFLFSSREVYFQSFFDHFQLTPLSFFQIIFFGLGDFEIIKNIVPGLSWVTETDITKIGRATFEMDFFDLFFSHGLIFFLFYFYFLFKMLKKITFYGGTIIKILAFAILAHSFLAGHVFFSTGITNVSLFLYCFVQQNKEHLQEQLL